MKKLAFAAFVALAAILAMSLMAVSVSATDVEPFTLAASAGQLRYDLPAGTVFNGTITASGTIRFWINAPSGVQIVNLGLVDGYGTFGFVAQQAGNYTLNFENEFFNPIDVSFSYTTNPDIGGAPVQSGPNITLLLVVAVVAVVGFALIFVAIRRKNKKQKIADAANSTLVASGS